MNEPPGFRAGDWFQVRELAGTMIVPGKGEVPVVFRRDDFAGLVGKIIPLTFMKAVTGLARVREADVADDGGSVLFTYEITDLSPAQADSDGTAKAGS